MSPLSAPQSRLRTVLPALLGLVMAMTWLSTGPAQADPTPGVPYPPSGSFTTTNVQMKASGCWYHPYAIVFDSGPMTESWYIEARVLRPTGTVFDIALESGENWAGGKIGEEMFFCSYEDTGTYTITGTITTYPGKIVTQMTPLTFQVLPVPAPVAPTVAPTPVVPPTVDVVGTLVKKNIVRGKKFVFVASATPVGSVEGRSLSWKVSYDDEVEWVRQGAGERDSLKVRFPAGSGLHRVRVSLNGKRVYVARVRTGSA